jgi:hypothetical protein
VRETLSFAVGEISVIRPSERINQCDGCNNYRTSTGNRKSVCRHGSFLNAPYLKSANAYKQVARFDPNQIYGIERGQH